MSLGRRLLPLQIGIGLQGFMLWVPVEKLFQTGIGFDAASIGLMAAAYAAVVPIFEVPSGVLADRWSRSGLLILAGLALAASSLLGGLSTGVGMYVLAAMVLGIYFAASSGTVDSIVYDVVVEETGSADGYERWIGRVNLVESAALATSAIAGGLLAGWTSPRLTYFVSVPFGVLAVVALLRFREPRLHRAAAPVPLHTHLGTTLRAMVSQPAARHAMLLVALAALLSQTLFEFGPLWLVAAHAPAAAFGPYWAGLVATIGLGGLLAARLRLDHRPTLFGLAGLLALLPLGLTGGRPLPVVVAAQTGLAILLAVVAIHAGRLLHDAVASSVRAGVSSGAGTLSWLLFLPFSIGFGRITQSSGVGVSAWMVAAAALTLALLLAASARGHTAGPEHPAAPAGSLVPAGFLVPAGTATSSAG
jgi:MFS family permease